MRARLRERTARKTDGSEKKLQVIESAQWFANGYFGRSWGSMNATAFNTIAENGTTISYITPMDTCAKWDYNYGNNVRPRCPCPPLLCANAPHRPRLPGARCTSRRSQSGSTRRCRA